MEISLSVLERQLLRNAVGYFGGVLSKKTYEDRDAKGTLLWVLVTTRSPGTRKVQLSEYGRELVVTALRFMGTLLRDEGYNSLARRIEK